MIFNPSLYFYGSKKKEELSDIRSYNSAFRNGILICPDSLYSLVIGSYAANSNLYETTASDRFTLNEDEERRYKAMRRLLDNVRVTDGNAPLFITPHVFTKFIHLLWKRKMSENHYSQTVELFKEEFSYVREEEIKREEIIDLKSFKCKLFGVSEAALIALKNKQEFPCIISSNDKILKEYKEDFLYIDFNELVAFVKDEERRNIIV